MEIAPMAHDPRRSPPREPSPARSVPDQVENVGGPDRPFRDEITDPEPVDHSDPGASCSPVEEDEDEDDLAGAGMRRV